MSIITTKQCAGCRLVLDSTKFTKHATTHDGLASNCRSCAKLVRDKLIAINKLSHPKNVDHLEIKICTVCGPTLKINFNRDCTSKSGFASKCKTCIKIPRAKRIRKAKILIASFKENASCVRCGLTDARLLEFDHIDPSIKVKNVSCMSSNNQNNILDEISKTQLLCKMCHRLKSIRKLRETPPVDTEESKRRIRNKLHVRQRKIDMGGCEICHLAVDQNISDHDVVFDFDHLDRTTKTTSISRACMSGWKIERIDQEIQKCRLLCCNCHYLWTIEQMGYYVHPSSQTLTEQSGQDGHVVVAL